MKSKKRISLVLFIGLLVYGISFIATSPRRDIDPCQIALENWYNKDTSIYRHSYLNWDNGDTLVISSDSINTINWSSTTDSICDIYKNTCNVQNKPILIVNRQDTLRSNWNTRFGKKIYFKKCP